MAIVGIGIDLCHIDRVRRSVYRLGEAWTEELFGPVERNRCAQAADPGLAFAKGFVFKEACAKALGSGFAQGVSPRDIIFDDLDAGTTVVLQGKAKRRLLRMTPNGQVARWHISFAHIDKILSCTALIDAVPLISATETKVFSNC